VINQLLGAGVAATLVALVAPVIVSHRHEALEDTVPRVEAAMNRADTCDASRTTESSSHPGFLGVVVARHIVELSARSDGTVDGVDVQVGDRVKSGTPIARLSSRALTLERDIADASVRSAEAEYDRARIEWEDAAGRFERLRRIPDLVSREQLAAAESHEKGMSARLRASDNDLAGKRARINHLKRQLQDLQIVAPFAGTIAARHVDPGKQVARGAPLVQLISPNSVIVRFGVPEEEASRVVMGLPVQVRTTAPDTTVDGMIERIVPEIDAALRMVVVEARLAENGNAATPAAGAIARVYVATHPDREGDRTPAAKAGAWAKAGHEQPLH
jgi:RND family efflux transporter MFP subunit